MQRKRTKSESSITEYYDMGYAFIDKSKLKPEDSNTFITKPIYECMYKKWKPDCYKYTDNRNEICKNCIAYNQKINFSFNQEIVYLCYTIILGLIIPITLTRIAYYAKKNNMSDIEYLETLALSYFVLFIVTLWYGNSIYIYLMSAVSGYSYKEMKEIFYYEI